MLKIVKQTRYVMNWDKGGHADSILDDTVYGAMLLEIDQMISDENEELLSLMREKLVHKPKKVIVNDITETADWLGSRPVQEQMTDDGCPNPPFAGSHPPQPTDDDIPPF